MQLSQVIPLLLFLAIGSSQALSEEEKKTLLQLHNDYRSKVTPPAADMLKMYWDTDLEKMAKSYAAECKWDHNPKRGSTGENLYLTSSKIVSMQGAMNMWHGEQKDYNFSTMACTENKMCGHYTQVVWAASSKVGCGEHFCEQVEKEKPNQSIMVCNYKPPGNVNGQRPYTEGKPCSKCPAEYKCVDNLCAYSIELEETSTAPTTATHEQPSSPELRTSPEVDLDLEDFSVASVTTEGIPPPQQASTHSLTSAPGVDRGVQETTTPWFTSTDPSSLHNHLVSTQVEVEEEKEDRDIALEDASQTSKTAQSNLFPRLTPSVRSITSPKGEIGLEENYQSAISPEPWLSPETSSLLHIVTMAGGQTLPFLSDPVSKTDSSAGRNFPTSIYFCLLSAIFGLKLFF